MNSKLVLSIDKSGLGPMNLVPWLFQYGHMHVWLQHCDYDNPNETYVKTWSSWATTNGGWLQVVPRGEDRPLINGTEVLIRVGWPTQSIANGRDNTPNT